jgi:hypothetical protein
MLFPRLAALALALSTSLPALASSTVASSASEGISASVGSASESFDTSSESPDKKEKTAAGHYEVIQVADLAERPGTVRLKLQRMATEAQATEPPAAPEALNLYLPAKVLAQHPITTGHVVSAKPRPYGVEFAHADSGRAFYLVLDDDWHRELQSNAVVL